MTPSRQPVSFIATAQPERAKAFYRDTLDLELIETSRFALVFRDVGHTLRIQIVETLTPASYTAHGWTVTDIASQIKTLRAKGVTFDTFAHLTQDAAGIWTTPDGHKIAWFKDPCGNILSLTEYG